jgi:hypothetical protein
MIFRLGGLWLAGLSCAATLGACVGVSSEVGSMDGGGGQATECEAGDTRPAGDGCNTCACNDDGGWSCTAIACACEDGATRPAGDGCNDCVCAEGSWSCTLKDCQTCTIGETRATDCGSCWCADNGDGPTWNCTANVCTECVYGETKPGENECSTCTCGMDGHWDCPVVSPCPQCMPGDTRPAGDGCNTCSCFDGTWGCTMKLCGQPVCDEGFGDCDGDPANGCETNLDSTVENCGGCGNHCAIPGAYAACEAGTCVLDYCDPPYADCNADPADGCESRVAEGGCEDRCEALDPTLPSGVPAGPSCSCPEGMTCVRGSATHPESEYCFPMAQGCTGGYASCNCMAACVCPDTPSSTCAEEMSIGGMIIDCGGYL